MSVSSPKEEAEAGAPSPENSDHMDRGDPEAQAGLYELDVKEQDRWLPIANGKFPLPPPRVMQTRPIVCADRPSRPCTVMTGRNARLRF